MQVNYNVKGDERKRLVKAIEDVMGMKAKYLGMPSAAYRVDYFIVNRNGSLIFDDGADSREVEQVLEGIASQGLTAEPVAKENEKAEELPQEENKTPQTGNYGLTVEIPLDKVAVGNLTKIIDSKESLIKKALGTDDLGIEVKEDRVAFPWFGNVDSDHAKAYTDFISALCKMSKEAVRVTAKEKEVDNEKYAFRCFLLRLGFIGAQYKKDRKILLENLTGSSAFRNGGKSDDGISE